MAPAHSIDTKPLYFRHNEAPSMHPSIHPRAGDSCLVAYFYRGVYGRHDGGRRTVITAASASTNCRQPGISLLISPILHMATCPSATLPRSQLFVPPPRRARPRPAAVHETCCRAAARRGAGASGVSPLLRHSLVPRLQSSYVTIPRRRFFVSFVVLLVIPERQNYMLDENWVCFRNTLLQLLQLLQHRTRLACNYTAVSPFSLAHLPPPLFFMILLQTGLSPWCHVTTSLANTRYRLDCWTMTMLPHHPLPLPLE